MEIITHSMMKDGDRLKLAPTLDKNNNITISIVENILYFSKKHQISFKDSKKLKIFKFIEKEYWESREKYNEFDFHRVVRYSTVCFHNGEYKILKMSRSILDLLKQVKDKNDELIIQVILKSGYRSYSESFISRTNLENHKIPEHFITEKNLKLKTVNQLAWDEIKKEGFNDTLLENGIDVFEIKNKIREKKLEKILKNNK